MPDWTEVARAADDTYDAESRPADATASVLEREDDSIDNLIEIL